MRRFALCSLLCLWLLISLSACQSTKGRHTGLSLFDPTPEDRVQQLVIEKKYDDAVAVYDKERVWFSQQAADPEVQAVLKSLSDSVAVRYAGQLQKGMQTLEAVQWPAAPAAWPGIKQAVAVLEDDIAKMEAVSLFGLSQYRPAVLDDAKNSLKAKRAEILRGASGAFAAYPLVSAKSFFDAYPISLSPESFLESQKGVWDAAVKVADKNGLRHLAETYGKVLPDNMKVGLGSAYFKALCPSVAKADVATILAAFEKTRKAGLELETVPGVKIAFLEVTSDTLKKKGVIEFPVAVSVDLPFEASAGSMKRGFNSKVVREADILILFNLAQTRTNRHVDTSNYVKSTYISGYREVNNPEWDVLQVELKHAETVFMTKSASADGYAGDGYTLKDFLFTDIWKVGDVDKAKAKLDELKEKVRKTPRYIKEPVYESYPYQRVEMESVKTGSVQYYIVDKRKKRYYSDFFDIQSKEFFTVAYNLMDTDPNLKTIKQTNVTEKDVDHFETKPVTVKLSELLDHYAAHKGKSRRYTSMAAIRQDIIKNRNVAVANAKKEDYGFDKREDKRFESVVVVQNATSLGTGFYVTSDLVLTNYHVVEEQKFVEMRKWDKTETFGKVIAKDVRLDLALVKVQDRGAPVTFYDRKSVSLGLEVEAIGHPKGIDFSLTRGVISSVRKHASIMRVQGKPVLFIQTDCPINPGNSGGPLFLGRFVIGVNDWGMDKSIAEGLNFSIHYSEVFKFLQDNNVAYRKGH